MWARSRRRRRSAILRACDLRLPAECLLVDAAGLAVYVGFVVVVVEDLQLVSVVAGPSRGEKNAAVAASLTTAGDVLGNFPLDDGADSF